MHLRSGSQGLPEPGRALAAAALLRPHAGQVQDLAARRACDLRWAGARIADVLGTPSTQLPAAALHSSRSRHG